MKFWLWVLAIAIGEVLGIYTAQLLAQEHRIVLKGTLFFAAPEEECRFTIVPSGESETLDFTALPQGYVCSFLAGFNAREFEIVLGSQSK